MRRPVGSNEISPSINCSDPKLPASDVTLTHTSWTHDHRSTNGVSPAVAAARSEKSNVTGPIHVRIAYELVHRV